MSEVVVTGTLKRGESGASPFPITQPTDSAMTEINVADIAARDLIAEWRRLPFMKVYTIATSQTFRLGADVTIAGQVWTLDTGAGTGFQLTSEKGQVNGYASLDANGKIPVNQINQLFITDVFVPADQAARFALTTFRGDIAIQQDTGVAFLKLNDQGPPTDAGDWASITTSAVSLITQGTFAETGNVSITISKILTLAQNVTDFNAQVAIAPAVTSLNSTLATHTLQITDLQNDKADKVNVLELDNVDAFVPTAPTHPTTKQYVDDAVAAGGGGGGGNTVGAIGDVQLTDGGNNHAAEGSFNYAIATNALTATGSRGAGGIGASSIVMGSTGGVATALNSKVFAQDTTVSGIGATSFARDTIINALADDAFAIGRNNIIGDGTTAKSGISSGAFGADHIVHGTYAYGFGLGAQASGEQSFVMAINTRDVSDDATFQRNIASGFGAISMFENTTAQTATHGVLGRTSVAIGGKDHNIPADANRVVILGGNAIKAAAGVSDRVYIPSLSIENSGGGGAVTFVSNSTSIEVTTNALIAGITPILTAHLATKGYVDAFVQGLDSKASCRTATTVALVDTYNGTGTGTLTKSTNGAFPSQDGVTLLVTERILLKNENGAGADVDNGLYALTQVGDGSNPWILTRTIDADEDAEVTAGLYVFVTEGTVQSDTGWTISTDDPITINTTPIAFVQFSSAGVVTADSGLTKTINNIQLGGALLATTTISGAFDLNFTNNNIAINSLAINNTGGGSNPLLTSNAATQELTLTGTLGAITMSGAIGMAGLDINLAGNIRFTNTKGLRTNETVTENYLFSAWDGSSHNTWATITSQTTTPTVVLNPPTGGGTLNITANNITSIPEADPGVGLFVDSEDFILQSRYESTGVKNVDWKMFVDALDDAGDSQLKIQTQINGAGYADRLRIGDDGTVFLNNSSIVDLIRTSVSNNDLKIQAVGSSGRVRLDSGDSVILLTAGVEIFTVKNSFVRSGSDNTQSLGQQANRFTNVFSIAYKTGQTTGNSYTFSAYEVGVAHQVWATITADTTTPTVVLNKPTNGTLTILDADRVGLNLTTGDVATPLEGEIWYNNTTNKFRAFENAAAVDMIGGSGDAYFVSNSSGTLPDPSGTDALAVGVGAVAANTNTIAIGRTAGSNAGGADGTGSISIGDGANNTSGVAIGQDSICIGRSSQSQSADCITIGRGAGSTSGTPGTFNISLGFGTNQGSGDIGQDSIAIGSVATATSTDAIAIGQFTHATASGAILLGHHTTDIVNDIADSFALGWNEAIPSYWLTKGVATTSSASVVTIVTVALPDQSAYWITARIIGGETDGTPTNFGFFHSEVAYQRVDGAGPVIIGAAVSIASEGAGAGITFTVSSNDILIRIGGVAATNMTWRAVVEFSRRDGL